MLRRKLMLAPAVLAVSLGLLSACSTNQTAKETPAQQKAAIDQGYDATLATLYKSVKGSQELAGKARAILVFPKVYAAGLGVGGEYGEGALRAGSHTVDYYKTTSLSFGFQAGAQSKALVLMFMTQKSYDDFRKSQGWTAGADASVALVKMGANGVVDTNSYDNAVNAFALTNGGLMAAATIEGSKISKLDF
ncbi:BPSL1445 family SYLF domain-containing lipoprotein [Roseateles koreensis]|uniref:YSC84-related protein n=1 Tax=Roseateles koreensis TaxID=2987526 RepID=A0ABT5KUT7_9BURK|nr:YSC84-related protein [Roseateles koreensis]MDC8786571.1 YSC84-related protein [Roseateles koreensis]